MVNGMGKNGKIISKMKNVSTIICQNNTTDHSTIVLKINVKINNLSEKDSKLNAINYDKLYIRAKYLIRRLLTI